MNFVTLSDSMVFSSGNGLWILPDAHHSFWSRKLDWYLNFVLLKASHHQPPKFSEEFLSILHNENLATPTVMHRPDSATLTETEHRLPARQAVTVPFNGEVQMWVEKTHHIWENLGRPQTRVFLPRGLDVDAFTKAWPKSAGTQENTMHVVGDR